MIRRITILTLIALGATYLVAWYGQRMRYRAALNAYGRTSRILTFEEPDDGLHAVAPGRDDHYQGFSFNHTTGPAAEARRRIRERGHVPIEVLHFGRDSDWVDGPDIIEK